MSPGGQAHVEGYPPCLQEMRRSLGRGMPNKFAVRRVQVLGLVKDSVAYPSMN